MIIEFSDAMQPDAHMLFQKWRVDNLDGFFINVKPKKEFMLHHVSCWHHGDTQWTPDMFGGGTLTKNRKICSADYHELEKWAEDNHVELKECASCIEYTEGE